MITYRSCEAMNHNFIVTEDGVVACPASETVIQNSLQRAYIFTNLFFYDIVQREINKLTTKIDKKRQDLLDSTGMPDDAVERQFPNLSAQFKAEIGDNSLDPLIKTQLGQIKPHLSLQLNKNEEKQINDMYDAIFATELAKFRKAVIFTQDNKGKPYQITFSEKYIANLPPRCQKFLKPTIKMLAYMEGRQFDQFELSLDKQHLTYTWAMVHPEFDEEKLKNELKSVIAKQPDDVV